MQAKHIAIALFVIVLWSFNFIASKVALDHFPIFFLLFLRLLVTCAVLLPFMGRLRISKTLLVVTSFTWAPLHIGAMYAALYMGVDVSVVIMIDQLRMPFAVILGVFIFKDIIGIRSLFGIICALSGTYLIIGSLHFDKEYWGAIFMLASAFAWAMYNIQLKFTGNLKVLNFLGWLSLLGLLQVSPLTFFYDDNHWELLIEATPVEYAAVFYSGVINTVIGNGLWYYLLKRYPVKYVVPYTLLVPVVGTFAAVFLLGEYLSWHLIAGGILTVGGVGIILGRRARVVKAGEDG